MKNGKVGKRGEVSSRKECGLMRRHGWIVFALKGMDMILKFEWQKMKEAAQTIEAASLKHDLFLN